MIERPAAPELLDAMASTLAEAVVPACEGTPQHAARVVANLCRILAREAREAAASDHATVAELRDLLSSDSAELGTLVAQLDEQLRSGNNDSDGSIHAALVSNTRRRLDITKPGYA